MKRLFTRKLRGHGITILLIAALLITACPPVTALAAYTLPYEIRVNNLANCVTVYKRDDDGNYKPYKAMVCSSGGWATPVGTYYTPTKYRWHELFGTVYGQYCTRIVDHVLFHSVPYLVERNPGTLKPGQFARLGTYASQGCVRLSTADAKWIYDNCARGTRVIIYADAKNPGPLGKPQNLVCADNGWDPSDIWSEDNPWNKKNPEITVPFRAYAADGIFTLLDEVTAVSSLGNDITEQIEVKDDGGCSTEAPQPGFYTITYEVTDELGRTAEAAGVLQITEPEPDEEVVEETKGIDE